MLDFISHLEKRWQDPDAIITPPFAGPKTAKPLVDPVAVANSRKERNSEVDNDEYAGGFSFETEFAEETVAV